VSECEKRDGYGGPLALWTCTNLEWRHYNLDRSCDGTGGASFARVLLQSFAYASVTRTGISSGARLQRSGGSMRVYDVRDAYSGYVPVCEAPREARVISRRMQLLGIWPYAARIYAERCCTLLRAIKQLPSGIDE